MTKQFVGWSPWSARVVLKIGYLKSRWKSIKITLPKIEQLFYNTPASIVHLNSRACSSAQYFLCLCLSLALFHASVPRIFNPGVPPPNRKTHSFAFVFLRQLRRNECPFGRRPPGSPPGLSCLQTKTRPLSETGSFQQSGINRQRSLLSAGRGTSTVNRHPSESGGTVPVGTSVALGRCGVSLGVTVGVSVGSSVGVGV